ncbi:Hypothetical protein I595_1582 [Croceitalea dokdonensis DOKDO 023]|uniref:Uncharacterized protein n=1 Tax=Croceitalea dokdonensis DOKDO 023 TaxID=1300341 RepID=A0A0P7AVK9_9FLAO|nr:Hypothetical protein I595_1582 [Croceitalea dokdonensis DOKDO 023]
MKNDQGSPKGQEEQQGDGVGKDFYHAAKIKNHPLWADGLDIEFLFLIRLGVT